MGAGVRTTAIIAMPEGCWSLEGFGTLTTHGSQTLAKSHGGSLDLSEVLWFGSVV